MKNYTDMFAQRYEYIEEYDIPIIQHAIPIKPSERPFRQKLIRINKNLTPLECHTHPIHSHCGRIASIIDKLHTCTMRNNCHGVLTNFSKGIRSRT